jgi:hypothetical protein
MMKTMYKSLFTMLLLAGLLSVGVVPDTMAQGRRQCRTNNGGYVAANGYGYQDDDYYRNRDNRRNRRVYDDDYYDRENTTGNTIKRAGIGAGIGAAGGALLGGKKGALIGAGVGAAGGYLYHRHKVNQERNRGYRY